MPNLLLLSDNTSFTADLSGQIQFYAQDFNILTDDNEDAVVDVIVLDDMPSTLKEVRNRHPKSPVLLLLSDTAELAESSNLNIIISKPLSLDVFLNQLRSSINLLENSTEGYLHFNRYELRPSAKEILNMRNNETIKLTEKEVSIIKYLYKSGEKIVSKNELLQEVWGYNPEVTTHTIETHIYRLRQKVEHEDVNAQLIMTEDGGYKLNI